MGGNSVNRDAFADDLARLLEGWGADRADRLRPRIAAYLEAFSDEELARHLERMAHTGDDWGYNPPDPVARQISRETMELVLGSASAVEDPTALAAARRRPCVLLGNHLSYVDVNVLDYLLVESGCADVAENLTAMVGPKVFAHPIRRLASLCFGTIKLPQSTSRASGEAVMAAREVAALGRRTIGTARERMRRGEHLLLFPEGARSRTRGLQRCLAAVARYLEEPDTMVLAWGHADPEQLVPIGETERVHPGTAVRVRFGPPVPAAKLFEACERRRKTIADVVGFLIADQLPESYRGVYASGTGPLAHARALASELS